MIGVRTNSFNESFLNEDLDANSVLTELDKGMFQTKILIFLVSTLDFHLIVNFNQFLAKFSRNLNSFKLHAVQH